MREDRHPARQHQRLHEDEGRKCEGDEREGEVGDGYGGKGLEEPGVDESCGRCEG